MVLKPIILNPTILNVLGLNLTMKSHVLETLPVLMKTFPPIVIGIPGLNGLNVISSVMVFNSEDNYVPVLI
jgi:hypothetical protein